MIDSKNFSSADHAFMARAIQLAWRGLYTTQPNPRVGCVLVKHGQIIAEGFHERAGQGHAEVNALQQAGTQAQGCEAFVSQEPCSHYGRTPPCADALIKAGVKRVVAAMVDPNPQVAGRGLQRLREAGIETACGLLEAEALALNPGFNCAMLKQRPYVRLKMAMSLDGRTAMRSGESNWITAEAARQDVQHWRARAGAVLTGIGTVLADNPSLNVRLSAAELGISGAVRQPLRVLLDSQLRLAPAAKWLTVGGDCLIYTCQTDAHKIAPLQAQGAEIKVLPGEQPVLAQVLADLYQRNIYELHVEAGAVLAGAFIEQQQADELLIYMAPCLLGSQARPLFEWPLQSMQERCLLDITEMRALGRDWRMIARPLYQGDQ